MLHWKEDATGFRDGRYEIVRDAPSGWLLHISGRPRSRHPTASAAKMAAARLERQHLRRVRLVRSGLLVGLIMVGFAVVWAVRTETNPARQPAEALIAQLDFMHQAFMDGSLGVEDVSGSLSLQAAEVRLNGGEELVVLMGEAGEECYTLFWSSERDRRARVLADSLECQPGPVVASTTEYSYKRQTPAWSRHLGAGDGVFTWDSILPPPTRQRVWFLPAILLLSAALASLLTRLSVTMLTGGASEA